MPAVKKLYDTNRSHCVATKFNYETDDGRVKVYSDISNGQRIVTLDGHEYVKFDFTRDPMSHIKAINIFEDLAEQVSKGEL